MTTNSALKPATPESAAACQLLYSAADGAHPTGRLLLFDAIRHLTGLPLALIERTWRRTA